MIFRILIIFLVTIFSLNSINAMAGMSVNDSLARAQTFLEQGQYFLALDEVNTAIQNKSSAVQQSRAYGMKGSLLLLMQHHEEAKQFLLKAFESSEDEQRKAGYANSLGVLYHDTNDMIRSKENFETALALAGNNRSLVLKIKLNQARSHTNSTDSSHLNTLFIEITTIDSASERTRYYLNLAETAKSRKPPFYSLAQNALEKARTDVLNINDKRLQLEILETLADLYETKGRDQQALELSKQASTLVGQANADDDVMLQIEWRKGRIFQRQGRDDYALTAYGKAVDHVQAIRMDIPVEYEDGRSSFRETMEPIYLGYVHHLLKKSANQKEEAKQRTLRLARQTIEQIKQTELEDFFGGRCLIGGIQRNELDSIDNHAAILYPIILPDRLELLVGIGNTIHQHTVPIPEKSIQDAAKDLANNLRLWTVAPHEIKDSEAYLHSSENLYRWIISPIQKDLTNAAIKTLVVVPDGVLRLVPFAAFYDGKHFLVEKYAISISPGMSLLGAKKNDQQHQNYRTLLAGVSKPGSVVEKLPKWLLSNLLQQDFLSENQQNLSGTRSIINSHSRSIADSNPLISHQDIDDFLKRTGMIEKLQEDFSLPGVKAELDTLNEELKNTTLFNKSFTVENFYQHISNQPFEIVHIATHGFFSSDADSSFLMAHDDILKLDDLQAFLTKNEKTRNSIQLLTFSACETAEGDDRAPLGFAGAALKANALSALGSLWPISDEAAPVIMTSFYKHLLQSFSKAESLKQAQLEMLEDPDMSHPSFWSPFILVGNWL